MSACAQRWTTLDTPVERAGVICKHPKYTIKSPNTASDNRGHAPRVFIVCVCFFRSSSQTNRSRPTFECVRRLIRHLEISAQLLRLPVVRIARPNRPRGGTPQYAYACNQTRSARTLRHRERGRPKIMGERTHSGRYIARLRKFESR